MPYFFYCLGVRTTGKVGGTVLTLIPSLSNTLNAIKSLKILNNLGKDQNFWLWKYMKLLSQSYSLRPHNSSILRWMWTLLLKYDWKGGSYALLDSSVVLVISMLSEEFWFHWGDRRQQTWISRVFELVFPGCYPQHKQHSHRAAASPTPQWKLRTLITWTPSSLEGCLGSACRIGGPYVACCLRSGIWDPSWGKS